MSSSSTPGNPVPSETPDPTSENPPPPPTPTENPTTPIPTPTTQQPTQNPNPTTANDPPPASDTPPANTDAPNTSTAPPADFTSTSITTGSDGRTSTIVITATRTSTPGGTGIGTLPSTSTTPAAGGSDVSSGGLSTGGKIAVAVVVPIAAVALLFVVGLFFWRKRRARRDEEEQRKQDLKDYAYNPNDPTIPPVAAGGDSYEMKEDTSSGYRGWGTATLAGSMGQKASTTMSGGGVSGEPIRSDGSVSPEGEILGAMGPPASQNRGDLRRGPSNASSRYSFGAVSEESEGRGIGVAYGSPVTYQQQQQPTGYEQYSGGNPYADNPYAFAPAPPPGVRPAPGPGDLGAPIIRDNPSRRTAQIQNASPYVQQPGISQNF